MTIVRYFFLLLLVACSNDSFDSGDASGDDVSVEAAPDAEHLDGAPQPDAIAIDASDAAVPFSCNPPPSNSIFCDDFDSVGSVDEGWTTPLTSNGGVVVLDATLSKSNPNSARMSVPISGNNAYASADLLLQDATSSAVHTTMSARAALRVSAVDASQDIQILKIDYGGPGASIDVKNGNLVLVYTNTAIDGGVASKALAPITNGQWTIIRIDLTQGPSAKVDAYIGGDLVFSDSPTMPVPQASLIRSVTLGMAAFANATAMAINLDDFDYAAF
jgi:hypothetical protein